MGRVTAMERDAKKVTPVEVKSEILWIISTHCKSFFVLSTYKKVVPLMSLLSLTLDWYAYARNMHSNQSVVIKSVGHAH